MSGTRVGAWGCVLLGKGLLTLGALRTLGLADPWPAFPHWTAGIAMVGLGVTWLWRRDIA